MLTVSSIVEFHGFGESLGKFDEKFRLLFGRYGIGADRRSQPARQALSSRAEEIWRRITMVNISCVVAVGILADLE